MQAQKYSIKNWPKDDQPREKLLRKNPAALSDSELLAILIHHGTPDRSAVDLAKDILALGNHNLNTLGKLSVKDLMKIKGIGVAKAINISAALELGRRRHGSSALEKFIIKDSKTVAGYLQSLLKDYTYEVFAVLFLNQANQIKNFSIVSTGGITATVADPRVVLKKALEQEATGIVLCHNHPSGNLKPSRADEDVTRKIQEACRYLDIRLLDHLIVSEDGYFSFADEGKL